MGAMGTRLGLDRATAGPLGNNATHLGGPKTMDKISFPYRAHSHLALMHVINECGA
jgi:hypothetical protein